MIENTTIQPGYNQQIFQHYQAGNAYGASRREQAATTETTEQFSVATDRVSLSYSSESLTTYDGSMTLHGVRNDGFDLLRGLVMNMFKEQGLPLTLPVGNSANGAEEISLEEITPEEANKLIADDGYFGIEQTAGRIVDLAIGIAGGDPARIDAIRAGVDKGFKEAFKALGDWLPDISYKTYDKVMEKLDAWVKSDTAPTGVTQ